MFFNDSMDVTTSCGCKDSIGSTASLGSICSSSYEKQFVDDLWIVYNREWREYLKTLWLEVLKLKQHFTSV